MRLNRKCVDWIIGNQSHSILVGLVTFGFPKIFVKSLLHSNPDRARDWKGRKACLTISFDCDYPKDVEALPLVLKTLSKRSVKSSFACVGAWIEKYPQEHMMILKSGHEIMNHTYSHPDNEILSPRRRFNEISRHEKKDEIEKCHRVCQEILGYEPIGCRIPHFHRLFTPEIYEILSELRYAYSSSTLLTNTEAAIAPLVTEEGIVEFPLSPCPKHPFTAFDTWHSFNSPAWYYRIVHRTEEDYIALFKCLVNLGVESHSYINVYLDPSDICRMNEFQFFLDYISALENELWIARYMDIMDEMREREAIYHGEAKTDDNLWNQPGSH